jgi:hypothetical protein
VLIASGASGIIEQNAKGVVRATHLSGKDLQMSVRGTMQRFSAQGPEEVIIADDGTPDEELIPIDGVERSPVSVRVVVAGSAKKTVRTQSFNKDDMMACVHLIVCNSDIYSRFARKHSNERLGIAPPSTSPQIRSTKPLSTVPTPFKAISFQSSSELTNRRVVAVSTSDSIIKHLGEASISQSAPGMYALDSGEVLVSTSKPITITSHECWVKLKANSLALVTRKDKVFSVRNLTDFASSSVVVGIGPKFTSSLAMGQEILTGLDVNALRASMHDSVSRRNTRIADVAANCSVMSSELSLGTLVAANTLLNHIFHSQTMDDRSIMQRMLKGSVGLSMVTAKHGPFSTDH